MGSAHRIGFALGAAVFFSALPALADDDPKELSKQGYELLVANKCEQAIPLLMKSATLAPDPRTLVNLGRCEEKARHLRAALEHFKTARQLASEKLTTEMVTQLDTMVANTEARIPHVKIFVAQNAPANTTVKHDDVEVQREQSLALDPGNASFVVWAPGYEPKTFTVTLAEGQTQSLTVAPGAMVEPPRPPIEPPRSEPNRSPLKTVGIITMIAGAGALALGGIFGAVALGKKGDAEDAGCTDRVCPNGNAVNLRNDAKSAGTVSTIFFIGGGVLAAAGLGVFILAPSASSDRVGLSVSGRF